MQLAVLHARSALDYSSYQLTSAQILANRPNRLLSGYRTPIAGLYLCGAGTHPGGDSPALPATTPPTPSSTNGSPRSSRCTMSRFVRVEELLVVSLSR